MRRILMTLQKIIIFINYPLSNTPFLFKRSGNYDDDTFQLRFNSTIPVFFLFCFFFLFYTAFGENVPRVGVEKQKKK